MTSPLFGWWLFQVLAVVWVLATLITLFGVAILTLLVWILLAVSFLPLSLIPALRAPLVRLQLLISNSVGDTYHLVHSPFSRRAMVDRVNRELDWLEVHATRVAVIAHSQGAVVAFLALKEQSRPSVKLFVTLGSPLRMLTADVLGTELNDKALDASLTLSRRETEWVDYFGTMDPVSAGRLWGTPPERATTLPVANLGSVLRDHGSYWRNLDGFVGQLAVRLARVAETPIDDLTPTDAKVVEGALKRRNERVGVLMAVRWLLLGSALAVLPFLATERLGKIGAPADAAIDWVTDLLPGSNGGEDTLPSSRGAGPWVLGAGVVFLTGVVVATLARATWSRWTRHAVRSMYQRQSARTPIGPRAVVGVLGAVGPVIVTVVAFDSTGISLGSWLSAVFAMVAIVGLVVAIKEVDYYDPPPKGPWPIVADAIETGREFAYKHRGKLRHVRVVDREEESPIDSVFDYLLKFYIGDIPKINKAVEMLDDNRPRWWRGRSARLGDRVNVSRSSAFVATWPDYCAWLEERKRWEEGHREVSRRSSLTQPPSHGDEPEPLPPSKGPA